MTRPRDPSRELLFGLVALQNGMIGPSQLSAAFSACKREPARSLVETILELGSIEHDHRRGDRVTGQFSDQEDTAAPDKAWRPRPT